VRRSLDALGMSVLPYYLYLEKRAFSDLSVLAGSFAEYDIGVLGPRDMPALAVMPGRKVSEAVYQQRLLDGGMCCGMKHNDEIVSFVWADTVETDVFFGSFKLASNEAYLFDAFTRHNYRGGGLAPFLRRRLYSELEKIGRVDLYSYSLYTNRPAIRFKEKLNARVIGWGVHFQVFKRFNFNLQLQRGRRAGIFISGFTTA
jgi:hypothetical protein